MYDTFKPGDRVVEISSEEYRERFIVGNWMPTGYPRREYKIVEVNQCGWRCSHGGVLACQNQFIKTVRDSKTGIAIPAEIGCHLRFRKANRFSWRKI